MKLRFLPVALLVACGVPIDIAVGDPQPGYSVQELESNGCGDHRGRTVDLEVYGYGCVVFTRYNEDGVLEAIPFCDGPEDQTLVEVHGWASPDGEMLVGIAEYYRGEDDRQCGEVKRFIARREYQNE